MRQQGSSSPASCWSTHGLRIRSASVTGDGVSGGRQLRRGVRQRLTPRPAAEHHSLLHGSRREHQLDPGRPRPARRSLYQGCPHGGPMHRPCTGEAKRGDVITR